MNVVTPTDYCQTTVEDVKLEHKSSSGSWRENANLTNPYSRTTPSGETYDVECFDPAESYPFHVSPNPIEGPWVSEEPDSAASQMSRPESLASSVVCADTAGHHLTQNGPRLSDESVTLPINSPCIVKLHRLDVHVNGSKRPMTPLDDESLFLSSSASIVTEDYERTPEPMQANVQYHRRKRLEWKLSASHALMMAERKLQETSNSWTVYDDLLEELEESMDVSGRHCDPSTLLDQSLSFNGLSYEHEGRMNTAIDKYLNQRFLNFPEGSPTGLCYDYLPSGVGRTCIESATMTEQEEEEKDDDEPSHQMRAHCLPLCRCKPRK